MATKCLKRASDGVQSARMSELVLIDERFELLEKVARGGMGAVYRAVDRTTQRMVAIKVLRDQTDEAINRFRHEAQVLGEIEHGHVVRYIYHGKMNSGDPYLVMEWLEGETLATRLERGALGIQETAELARRVASGLAAAHARGIVHRDVKPGNVFLANGQISQLKLLDFGIARLDTLKAALTVPGTIVGTPGYMAPEQAKGPRNRIDSRVDVFSLGCVLFECLTGRPAFQGTHILARLAKLLMEDPPRVRELRPDVPENFDELISVMLSKDPEKRPADCETLAMQIERMGSLEGLDLVPRRSSPQSLTHTEKRLVSVVAVVPFRQTGDDVVGEGTVLVEESLLATVRRLVRPFGAKVEEITNGMFVVLLVGTGPATDQAAIAARCALRLRLLMPNASIVLLTGRGENTGRLPVGEVFESATSLLVRMNAQGHATRGIYIDEITRALLDVRFGVTVESGRILLWGEQDVVAEVRTLLGRPSPFVGRDRELRHLFETVEEAIEERHGRVVLVTGEAGTGKSRLRYEFIERLQSKYPRVAVSIGRGDSTSAGSAFLLLASAFRSSMGIAKDEPLPIARNKIEDTVSPYVAPAERLRVTEFLGELIGVPCADENDPRMRAARQNPTIMADQVQSAYLEFVRSVVATEIVVFVLEDVHWGDGPSIKLIDTALRELSDKPFIVVAFARPNVHQVFPRLWAGRGVHSMTLGGLTRRGSEALIKGMLGPDTHASTIAAIVDRSGGNAFYLEELIRAVAEGRGAQLPETVLGMVEARIAALEPGARRTLRAASIFGDTFWEGALHKLLQDEGSSYGLAYIKELCARELITRRSNSRFLGEVEYTFRHSLLREGAYAMLTDRDRALGHELAGEWLRHAGEPDPMVLAEHFEHGTVPRKAACYYAKAAEQALRGADFPAALTRTEKGLALGAEGEAKAALHGTLSSGYILTAQYAKAYESASSVLADATLGSSSRARALGYAVASAIFLGKYDVFGELFPEILTIEPEPNVAALIAQALYSVFIMFVVTGQSDHAAPYLQRMVKIADKDRNADFLTAAWTEFALMFAAREMKNDLWLARQHNIAAADRYAAAGAREYVAITNAHLGLSHLQLGLLAKAEQLLDGVLAMPDAGKLAYMYARYYKSRLFLERKQLDEALEMTAILAEEALAANDHVMLWCARLLTVGILVASDKLDAADGVLDELAETNAFLPFLRARFLSLRADICRRRGRAEDVVVLAAESVAVGRAGPRYNYGEDPLRLRYALVLHAAGRWDTARDVIRQAREDLLGCAAKIPDEAVRRAYLENIATHAQTLALARDWLNDHEVQRSGE